MEHVNNFDVSLLLAAMGIFFAGLGGLLKGLAKLLSILPATPDKRGLFGKKK